MDQGLEGLLERHLEATREMIRESSQGLREDLGAKIDANSERITETRRHLTVLIEGVRDDVRAIAEGLETEQQRSERFQEETRNTTDQLDRRVTRLEAQAFSSSS